MQIVSKNHPLTFLEQRLNYARKHPERDWVSIVENIPCWDQLPINFLALLSDRNFYDYQSCYGSKSLISEIVKRDQALYGIESREQQILVTNGALHAISLLFSFLLNDKAQLICQIPVLTNINAIGQRAVSNVKYVPTDGKDAATITKHITGPNCVVYLNFPNNPSGCMCTAEFMESVVESCLSHGAALIMDQIYDSYCSRKYPPVSPFQFAPPERRMFTVNSFSKNYGLPGIRIGWITASFDNVNKLAGLLESQCVAVSGNSQEVAEKFMRAGNSSLVAAIQERSSHIQSKLSAIAGLKFVEPEAGTQFLVKLPVDDIEKFADHALDRHGLILATASNFVGVDGPYIRIPLGYTLPTIDRALDLLQLSITTYR